MPIPYISLYILIGAAIAFPLILLNIKFAPILGTMDWPKARGLSDNQIPIVGYSLVFISVVLLAVLTHIYNTSPWILTTALVMAVMGYLDDRKPLPATDKMFLQIVCVVAVVIFDPQIHATIMVKYGFWGSFLAIFFILGLVNALNFIDGIDGLAGIVIFTGSLGFLFLANTKTAHLPYLLFANVLTGMMIPFFYINVIKRQGFLGNVGSYFFSYLLAIMHLSIPLAAEDPVSRLSINGLCFIVPIADGFIVVFSRLATLRSPFVADKGHLHHRLIQTNTALRWVLACFAIIAMAGMSVGVWLNSTFDIRHSLLPALICINQIAVGGMLIVLIEKASKRRIQSYFKRLDSGEPVYFLKYHLQKKNGERISACLLRRLEAKVSAEIRITDLCFAEKPDTLFVTLKTLPEPLKGIAARLEPIFQTENVESTLLTDHGEYVKVSYPAKVTILKRA
ncbi:MAG: undecaprenyl/decaprenyl-phosphate alpha-N-acetylglucosaminyl 1-phosphate transferase [Deltaproteobacteria bacterium]|nr:undecaprenyl/decaprenyl-phosphate alpha-N-acetylglucosaminyl 1-phosphate transferase [Deltaproteobacteria bacterium]